MLFFALMLAIALVAAGVQALVASFDLATSLRWGMALALIPSFRSASIICATRGAICR